jgi:hypothetical protein
MEASTAPGAIARFRRSPALVALAAWAALGVCCSLLARLYGYDPFAAATWERWDSRFYLEIASGGYQLNHCRPLEPAHWCGSTGWFPGYPALVRLLATAGLPLDAAALTVALVCSAGVLWLVRESLTSGGTQAALALAIACVFPGSIYLRAAFPLAALLVCVLLAVRFAAAGRYWPAALFALLAATMYPVGVVVGPAIALAGTGRGRWLPALGAALGLGLVCVAQHVMTGHWDGYLLIHRQAEEGLHNPLDTLGARLKPLVNRRYWERFRVVSAVQTLFVTAFMAWLLSQARALWGEGGRARTLLVYCVLAWLMPLFAGGNVTFARSECALLPAVWFVQRWPRRTSLVVLAALALLFAAMELLFLTSELV